MPRRAVDEMYDTGPQDLPGDDDLGSLNSRHVRAGIGPFPAVPGTSGLVVSGPMFDRVTIDSADSRRRITLKSPGGDEARYVTSLKVNGRATTRNNTGTTPDGRGNLGSLGLSGNSLSR
ncbi:glycoside hydrolase domain-containing protein [Streptomyces sp. QTS137]